MTRPPEPFAVFRLYVAGRLVSAEYANADQPDTVAGIATRQGIAANAADERGERYMVECEFFDGECVRWGTDAHGMVIPVEVGVGQLLEALERRHLA